ncbi:hypothetical protein ACLETR_24600, partial [Escherichia coli]
PATQAEKRRSERRAGMSQPLLSVNGLMMRFGGLLAVMMIWRPQGLLPMTRPQLKLKNGAAKGEQA